MGQPEATIIELTPANLAREHICCAISARDDHPGIRAKKEWLEGRMREGLKFRRLDARGKVFIEYIPAERGWMPVDAPGYTLINCLWVSGSFKGKGYGRRLLDECERDAATGNGVVVVVGNKKKPFLADKSFFARHGYEVCDRAEPWFELMVKKFDTAAPTPVFYGIARRSTMPEPAKGVDIFYTHQCPFTAPYIAALEPVIAASAVPVRTHLLSTREQARGHCCPVTTYGVFVDGKFRSGEVLNPERLGKLLTTI